ncbi:MAG: glycosyl hydrolase, partial [Acetobacteraceae bacterium]|nr:glycosyl hydrolase [Acetobacteraceae bacterium]
MKRVLAAALLTGVCLAQTYGPEYFKALKWRNVGPVRGGRSIASAGAVGRPNEYYFGAVGGGLWKTTDGGETWNPVTDGQLHSSSVGAVAVSESNPDVVYIGMGEACLRGNIMQGDGIYRSSDAGKTWQHMGLDDSQTIARIRVHPTNPDLVYAAVFGHPAGPNDMRGVYRSSDGGKTWERKLFRDGKTGAVDLAMDRGHPNVLYAAMWEAYRVSWQMSSGGPGSGLFKTTDGGDTWTEITRNPGLPKGTIGRIGIAISGGDSNRLYALVEADDGGVFRSDDGGATWTRTNDDRKLRQRAFYYTHIFADPKDKDTVYALNTGFYKSTDGGKTFKTTLRPPHGDNHDLWIDPTDAKRMVSSDDGGGTVSINGGQTWTKQGFATAQLYHVATTRDFPYHACGAQQDNSTICVPSDAAGQGFGGGSRAAVPAMYAVGGGESGYIAPDPRDANVFYAGSQGALLTRYDRSSGQSRDVEVFPRFFSGEAAATLPDRWQWTFPIVFSPLDPGVLYTSSQFLYRTTNQGQSWDRISPDLTRHDPKTLGDSGGPITHDMNGPEIFATIFTIAPSRRERATIWTGSDDGLVFVTRDNGRNWQNVTPPGLPELVRISLIEASPHRPGGAYVAAQNYQQDDRAPYIFRTDDYGRTWKKIVNGIRPGDYVHAVREDPARAGLLYAGAEHGIYVSFDNGESWQSLSLNLPDTQVSDIVVEDHDVVIATHGRSMYVLDNVAPLRQMKTLDADYVFQPEDGMRRPRPVAIDYFLKAKASKVTIEILDGGGKAIRSFTGQAEDASKKKPADDAGDDEGFRPPEPKVTLDAGLNRFVWDLRYSGSTTFPGMILWGARAEQGPLAVP